jgi:Family of unknown function (DUF6448)
MKHLARLGSVALAVAILSGVAAGSALAHCDTMDGPVVTLAKRALDRGDVTLVLPWVAAGQEKEIREAFDLAVAVRGKGPKEKDLADRYFLETLVRVHREGEGAPFTGLKSAGLDMGPAIPAADKALETGDPGPMLALVEGTVREGVHKYYVEAMEKKKHAGESVEAGRAYVQAYVPFLHFVERLYNDAITPIDHGAGDVGGAGHRHPEPAVSGNHVH